MPSTTIQSNTAEKMHNIVVRANDSKELPTEIEVLSTGMWDAPYHGMFMINETDIAEYINNFNTDVRPSSSTTGLPIDFEHDTDGGAAGWITSLYSTPNDRGSISLWGKVTWSDLGKSALLGGVYKFFSPEFCPKGYTDPEGKDLDCDNVLLGGGLTNRPLFKGLKYVMASDGTGNTVSADDSIKPKENSMQLEDIRAKDANALTDEEKQFVAEHKDELTADERSKFDLQPTEQPAAPADEPNGDEEPEVKPEAPTEPEAPAEPVAANDAIKGNVSISASELEALKASAAKGELAHKALEDKRHTEDITGLVFSASDKGQKFKSDQKDDVVSFYLSCNDTQKEAFKTLVTKMPSIVSASDFEATGNSSDVETTTSAQASNLLDKANAIVAASDGKTSLSAALVKVATENPELAREYEKSLRKGNQ